MSLKFAELAAENFLRASMIWGEILGGGKFEAFKKLVEDYTHTYVQGQLGMAEIPSLLYLGQEGINDISLQVTQGQCSFGGVHTSFAHSQFAAVCVRN